MRPPARRFMPAPIFRQHAVSIFLMTLTTICRCRQRKKISRTPPYHHIFGGAPSLLSPIAVEIAPRCYIEISIDIASPSALAGTDFASGAGVPRRASPGVSLLSIICRECRLSAAGSSQQCARQRDIIISECQPSNHVIIGVNKHRA